MFFMKLVRRRMMFFLILRLGSTEFLKIVLYLTNFLQKHLMKKIGGQRTYSRNSKKTAIGGYIKTSLLPWQRPLKITNQQLLTLRALNNKVKEVLTFCSQNLVVNSTCETWCQQNLHVNNYWSVNHLHIT